MPFTRGFRSAWLVLALASVSLPIAAAAPADPSPTAQYQAFNQSIQRAWSNKVLNDDPQLNWVAPGRVVLRVERAAGRWAFVQWTAEAGASETAPAFDHAAAASDLSRLLGRPVAAESLPLVRFAVAEGRLIGLLDPEAIRSPQSPVAVELEPQIKALDALPEAFAAARTGQGRSSSGPPTSVVVRNHLSSDVELFWLNPECEAVPYGRVAAGERLVRTTFAGHVWSVRSDKREVLRFVGEPAPSVADIRDAGQPADEPAGRPANTPPSEPSPAAPSNEAAPVAGPEQKPAAPPPPKKLDARIRRGNLYLLEDGVERSLSTGHSPDAGFVGPVHWSPDRSRLMVMFNRAAKHPPLHLVEARPVQGEPPLPGWRPRAVEVDYRRPGDPVDESVPWVFDVASGQGRAMSTDLITPAWSLGQAHWVSPDAFRLIFNQRGHQAIRLVEFNAATGAGRTVVEETSDTFVDYPNKIFHRRLSDSRLLWMSQRSGFNHVYLLDGSSGAVIRPLTSGKWMVRSVQHVSDGPTAEQRWVLLRVMGYHAGQDPYHMHFLRVEIESGKITVLTDADGDHSIERSPDGAHYTAVWQRVDHPPVHQVRRWADGALLSTLSTADASALIWAGWRPPERFVAKGRDGVTDIWGVIFFPSNLQPTDRLPVIEHIYAGPHDFFVPKRWEVWRSERELAERGFIVVRIDGMGTNWRSKAFHDVAHRNLADSGFPDRIAWLRAAAARFPQMDLGRVGIYGGSAGGQSALRAVLAHGEFYRAAAADCGCHDNRVDKQWWNELWMGYPVGPHYHEQSNVTNAHRLQGRLLLTVGAMDRNVDPQSTMQVADALIAADKDFTLLVVPGAGHGAGESPYARRQRYEFFREALGAAAPGSARDQSEGAPSPAR
ncbi:MAG: prolyl oligopeptidase family serine peptidase [Planctomycetaceae bacterium]|jgi:dipeptidyl-peptidase-4|nr:prolyl oligopeptidase family serine peptidase [Phycisphaerales bacterium]MCE2652590.1 prolyl oligopeptidase family serine peptidase [Planctomycetaceae bacterium]